METLILTAADLRLMVERVGLDELLDLMIARLRQRFAEHDPALTEVRTRDGFRYDKPALGLLEWMPVHDAGGSVVIKMVGYHPTNPVQRSVSSVLATSSMWDTETGHLVALADATLLTAMRTAAASAVATDILAIPGSVDVGIVGLGAQSVAQLHALSRVREVRRVLAFDTSTEAAASFPQRIGFLGVEVDIIGADSLDRVVTDVDVLVTCTSVDIGAGPVVPEATTRPWLHVNAVGADFPGKIELPSSLLEGALVVPDCVEQCVVEGECQALTTAGIGPDITALVQRGEQAHVDRTRRTVFDSTGWAIEDEVALRLALELADAHGLGRTMQIEWDSTDPLHPYEGLV